MPLYRTHFLCVCVRFDRRYFATVLYLQNGENFGAAVGARARKNDRYAILATAVAVRGDSAFRQVSFHRAAWQAFFFIDRRVRTRRVRASGSGSIYY